MLLAQGLAPYYCSSFGGTKKQETFSDFLLNKAIKIQLSLVFQLYKCELIVLHRVGFLISLTPKNANINDTTKIDTFSAEIVCIQ